MHSEWWNEPEMHPDERALERREHWLRALNHGVVLTVPSGTKEELRAHLDFFITGDPDFSVLAGYFLTEEQIEHLLEHGYIPGKDIALSTGFLINDDSILLRRPLLAEFMGYPEERDD